MSNLRLHAFQIPRFCPTAPGSSVYKPPSYVDNKLGPGSYFKSLKFTGNPTSLDRSRSNYNSKRHKDLAVVPNQIPASIPSKKSNQNSYTGNGLDTVGPAVYNPDVGVVKGRAPVGDFITSKQQRKLFEHTIAYENKLPATDNPGPDKYESVDVKAKKNFNSTVKNSIFSSKVPNCKDAKIKNDKPGPGHYTNVMPHKLKEDVSTASETGESSFVSGASRQRNPFVFTTHRSDFWSNEVDAPYTKQTFMTNPGPGHYPIGKKKGDDIKSRLLVEETVNVAFN